MPLLSVLLTLAMSTTDADPRAARFLDLLRTDPAAAAQLFDPTMAKALPAEKLAATRAQVEQQFGALDGCTLHNVSHQAAFHVHVFRCNALDVTITLDKDGRVAGLFFAPAPDAQSAPLPVSLREEQLTLKTGRFELPAILTLPAETKGPVPAVVLIHGSGPDDRDETVGPYKPFRDLAWELGKQGIATLRYEKRTHVYKSAISDTPGIFTVDDETVDDAVTACQLLLSRKDISRVILLGHSLGAMVMPRVATRCPKASSMILLAPPARPLHVLALEQFERAEKEGRAPADVVARMRTELKRVPTLTPADAGSKDVLFGAPPAYWLDLRSLNPVEDLKKDPRPILLLQGEADTQVTMEDFRLWKKAVTGKHTRLQSFPKLGHLFIREDGAHVDRKVIDTITTWILER